MATARAEIRSRRVEMALSLDEEESLDLVEARFGFLAARWERIERICDDTPETLVHADLKDRNVRIRRAGAETCLLPVDWELAGWGPLAVDLAKCPDLDLYADRVQRRWPDLTRHRLRRLQDAGRVFRAILALSWEIERLNPGNAPWSIRRLLSYVAAMDGALERIGMPAP